MAAAAGSVDTSDDQRPDDQSIKKRNRPPNRRRHEEQLEELMNQIRPLEEKIKSLGRPQLTDSSGKNNGILEKLNTDVKRLRDEKEAAITKRKAMDQDLRVLNDKIGKMSDSLSKLEAGLKFKTQSAIDDAIRKLDHQLQTRHFKYTEENRIVREIDSLRRSKKKVKEYQERRKEMDDERLKKMKLKSERDKYFFMVSTLKRKEDAVKQQILQLRSKETEAWNRYKTSGPEREALKKEIDSLYEQKRQLIAEFRQQQNEYHEQAKLYRAETLRKREEEKKAMVEAKQKAWDVYEASLEPYEEERQTCSALIKYLQKFQTAEPFEGPSPGVSPIPSPSAPQAPSSMMEGNKEFTVLKKKDDEDVFLPITAVVKRRKSGRRSRKSSWINKPMRHTAQIFSQFANIGLTAPTTPADLTDVLDQLYAKKQQYKEFSRSAMAGGHRRHLSGSSTLSTNSSQATSDVESSQYSTITSIDSTEYSTEYSTEDRSSPNSTELRTHLGEEKDDSNSIHDCEELDEEQEQSKLKCKDKSVPKLNTKLSALNISAAQSLQAKKNSEQMPLQTESQIELALPSHTLEPEATGDGGSSSSATESTLPETPLSDMSAPFDTHSGDGLDSGIDETRVGGKSEKGILNEEDELNEFIDNDPLDGEKLADMNANNPVIASTSTSNEEMNNCHNAKQDQLSCNIDGDIVEDTAGLHLNTESESFHEQVHQREQSAQEVTS
ncbi:uncharacterized protein [Amphiura filiformis]|uniref:uncharacterized protein n=1 Tax=Amphiura filiformis TaxID=82378 RepID=UPI003B211FA2